MKLYDKLSTWLRAQLGLSPHQTAPLSTLFPDRVEDDHKPYVIVLDQFDDADNSDLKAFFHTLAADCTKHKNYVVLVTVSDPIVYDTILEANGGKKIIPVYMRDEDRPKWNRAMLSTLFDEQVCCFECGCYDFISFSYQSF